VRPILLSFEIVPRPKSARADLNDSRPPAHDSVERARRSASGARRKGPGPRLWISKSAQCLTRAHNASVPRWSHHLAPSSRRRERWPLLSRRSAVVRAIRCCHGDPLSSRRSAVRPVVFIPPRLRGGQGGALSCTLSLANRAGPSASARRPLEDGGGIARLHLYRPSRRRRAPNYSAASLAASAGTTSFTAPRQPEWVRSNTTPSGPLNFTS
jgi:hypothetical protein